MSEYQNYDDYYSEENEEYTSGQSTAGKVAKKIFFITLRVMAVFVIALLLWRMFSTRDTKFSKAFIWNESAIDAYNSNSSDFIAYECKKSDNITRSGRFTTSNVYFVPMINQIQFTVRYNNSTLKALAKDYELSAIPTGENFIFVLEDNLGNIYTEYEYTVDAKNLYNYRKVIFDGIDTNASKVTKDKNNKDVTEYFESLTLKIYYVNDVLLSMPYDSLVVYHAGRRSEELDLEKYMFENNTATSGLTKRMDYVVKEEPETESTAEQPEKEEP